MSNHKISKLMPFGTILHNYPNNKLQINSNDQNLKSEINLGHLNFKFEICLLFVVFVI